MVNSTGRRRAGPFSVINQVNLAATKGSATIFAVNSAPPTKASTPCQLATMGGSRKNSVGYELNR